jgi:2',3'-cyclic-nucleotide 2'-phosphodiesterase (5'-nucleotidase family)
MFAVRRIALLLLPALLAGSLAYASMGSTAITPVQAAMTQQEPAVTLTLLHNNDGESGLLPTTSTVGEQEVPVGGIAAFNTVAKREIEQATQAGNAALMVYAGDAFLASATIQCSFPIDSDQPLYDALAQSQVPYDAHILGNHEFDYTPTFLKRFIDGFNDQQPFLSANLDFSGEPDFAGIVDADGLIEGAPQAGRVIGRSLIITDSTTNEPFGIIGATTTALASVSSPRNVTVLDLEATVTAVQNEIDRLQNDQGVNKIILVSHLQDVDNDRQLIEQLSGVDVAVAGGGDDFLVNSSVNQNLQLLPGQAADEIEGEYPLTVTDAMSRTVYLVTSVDKYRFLGRLDVTFDDQGEVIDFVSESSYPRRVVEAGAAATALGINDAVTPDADIISTVNTPVQACLDELASPIASTEILFNVSRDGVRGGENNTGNLVADSFIDSYKRYAAASNLPAYSQENPVVAIQNGGGIRQNAGDVLPRSGTVPGELTALDTIDVLPFNNFITVVEEVSPTLLLEVLSGIGTSGIYHVSNLRLDYSSATEGENTVYNINRITLVNFDGSTELLVENGQPVPGAPNVTVVTNSFVGDREFAATEPNQTNLVNTNGSEILYEQPLREYLQNTAEFPLENGRPTVQADDPRYQPEGEGRILIDGGGNNRAFLPLVSLSE